MSLQNKGGGVRMSCDESGCSSEAQFNTRDPDSVRESASMINWSYDNNEDKDFCPTHSE